jgi:LPS sulfotransferase NodH
MKIPIQTTTIAEKRNRIPASDFVDAQYDREFQTETKGMLVIFSSPRSGSTFLCDLLRKNNVCLAHEYFQPYEYLPILAERWNCINEGYLDVARYAACLQRFRTFRNGWLGVNLHGHHLPIFRQFESRFSGLRKFYLNIVRRDVISQAVSYEIASQTGKWSNQFASGRKPVYRYDSILDRLRRIQECNCIARAFMSTIEGEMKTIYYEDLVEDPEGVLRAIPCFGRVGSPVVNSTFSKQAGHQNKDWSRRFSEDFLRRFDQLAQTSHKRKAPTVRHLAALTLDRIARFIDNE